MSTKELEVLSRANLDWTVMLHDVWNEPGADIPEFHAALRAEFSAALDGLAGTPDASSPAGWVVVGPGGSGKTHLLGRFRAECMRRKTCFVLVDMTDVRDFWDTVLLGYFTSLQQPVQGGRSQFEQLVVALLSHFKWPQPVATVLSTVKQYSAVKLQALTNKMLAALSRRYPGESFLHGDVLRALMVLTSNDFALAAVAANWLISQEIDGDDRKTTGLTKPWEKSSQIVRGLSWLMSLAGPSVVALDQLDPIVTQLNLERGSLQPTAALAIINKLGAGLSELREVTRRTLAIVSCVDQTWGALNEFTPKPFTDRYQRPRLLAPPKIGEVTRAVVAGRMQAACGKAGFQPPYPTWPFKEEWLEQRPLDWPRETLKACHAHVAECLRRSEAREVPPGWLGTTDGDGGKTELGHLDLRFGVLKAAVNLAELTSDAHEDDQFGDLLRCAVRCALNEVALPTQVDATVDENFTGPAASKPLHARLRLIFPQDSSREEHVCLRALQKNHGKAFTARLRSAITQAGIDKALKYRRLVILRTGDNPGGAVTGKVIQHFDELGGVWLKPSSDDLATLDALRQMEKENDPKFKEWLRECQPASRTQLVRQALKPLFALLDATKAPSAGNNSPTPTSVVTPVPPPVTATATNGGVGGAAGKAGGAVPKPAPGAGPAPGLGAGNLLLGYRLLGDKPASQPTTMPLKGLEKHGVVFAGAGSGKTVLLKRLIEEAALLGVPSIVVDPANDLAAIGDEWPAPPTQWTAADAESASRFRATTECVVWTPGKDDGNPLGLEPLPDLTALVSSPAELKEALAMAVDALAPVIATGPKAGEAKKRAILTKVLDFLANHGDCNLDGLGTVLHDLPEEATAKIADERKMAAKMGDELNAQLTINPLLQSGGPILDPASLLNGSKGKTRISIVSLIGLSSLESQRHFLNQLAMILFTWIKKHPAPPNLPLRGLLVVDEARDFVPSGQASSCLGSMQRLAAQARKYGLGVILATQNPKDIDNKIIGQCSTHWYGKMSSPAAINAVEELLRSKGSQAGDDVGSLKTGRFYVSNADHLAAPTKLMTPMCLSAHKGPLDPEAIVQKAVASRGAVAASAPPPPVG